MAAACVVVRGSGYGATGRHKRGCLDNRWKEIYPTQVLTRLGATLVDRFRIMQSL